MNHDDSDKGRGLYQKYVVQRTDGRDGPGDKHDGCRYFVLDLDCDPLAVPAIEAYEKAASKEGYHDLARDLRMILHEKRLADVDFDPFER